MDLLAFAAIIGKLKTLKRTGWVMHDIPEPESVADHSFRLAMLSMVLADKFGADQAKTVKMALLHDVGEAIIGDIVTQRGSKILPNREAKQAQELVAFRKISKVAGFEDEWTPLFEELLANKTPEAKLVNQLDRLEAAIQANEYEDLHGLDPTEWLENTASHLHSPELIEVLEKLKSKPAR